MDDRQLVKAMQRTDARAFEEFYARFWPVLVREARRIRVPPWERETVVLDVLADAAVSLAEPTATLPRSLAAYLIVALRNRVVTAHRANEIADRHATTAASASGYTTVEGTAVASMCSEASVRASRGTDAEPLPLAPALVRLVGAIEAGLTDEERLLLAWASHHVPNRQIAEWLNISYECAAKRIARLRVKLRRVASAHAAGASVAERETLRRFFERSGHPETGREADEHANA